MADKQPMPPEKQQRESGNQLPPGLGARFWWVVLLALFIWNAVLFLQPSKPETLIPYSTFLEQVSAGNVSEVVIVGPQISGTFVKPILWPESSAAGSASGAGKAETPVNTGSENLSGSREGKSDGENARKPGVTPQKYGKFATVFPESVGDPTLMPLLGAHHVTVNAKTPSKPWFVTLLVDFAPMLLLILYFVWMSRQAMRNQSSIFGIGQTKARRYSSEQPKVTFKDVADAEEAKGDLEEVVDFLQHPQKYHQMGARIPRGTLLVGPPGTGKTLLARAVAGEAGVPFFSISASEFVEMFVGVGASRVRSLFEQAKAASPSIVFVDELDAVGRRRGAGLGAVNDEREQTLNQLLVEMDGFDEHQEIIVLAATNRPDVLDPALLRPGRFDRQVMVPLPDREGREGILRIHTAKIPIATDVKLDLLSRKIVGMSGADIANICNEAALVAARRTHEQVGMADFEEAIDKVILGGERPSLTDPDARKIIAYHESGHAAVAWLTPAADPVHRVTIIPHGRALGITEQVPSEERYNYSRTYLVARIDVMLGGRLSEQVVFGDVTTGAENDLIQATSLARRMMTRWGMGSLGPVAFESDDQQPFLGYELSRGKDYSESTAARIDEDVRNLIAERCEIVTGLLNGARDKLDKLAETLLHEETVDEVVLEQILGAGKQIAKEPDPGAKPETT
ncbi:MAG: ATP-dependent zinc metalloprotease FtsH [Syntrophobacteraceae bacterium]